MRPGPSWQGGCSLLASSLSFASMGADANGFILLHILHMVDILSRDTEPCSPLPILERKSQNQSKPHFFLSLPSQVLVNWQSTIHLGNNAPINNFIFQVPLTQNSTRIMVLNHKGMARSQWGLLKILPTNFPLTDYLIS